MASATSTTSHVGSYWIGEDVAKRYHKYRPVHSEEMIRTVLNYMNSGGFTSESGIHSTPETTCIDVGCGSGQSTKIWAPYFKKVCGVDISKEQIKLAEQDKDKPANVHYEVSPAEDLPMPDASVHLIVCSMSVHWFNIPKFLTECERVLVAGGVIALLSYSQDFLFHLPSPAFMAKEEELQNCYNKFKSIVMGYHYTKYNHVYNTQYQDIPLPFKERKSGYNHMETNIILKTTVAGFLGYLGTFSPVTEYQRAQGDVDVMKVLEKDMMGILSPGDGVGSEDVELHVTFPVFYVLTKK